MRDTKDQITEDCTSFEMEANDKVNIEMGLYLFQLFILLKVSCKMAPHKVNYPLPCFWLKKYFLLLPYKLLGVEGEGKVMSSFCVFSIKMYLSES